MARWSLPALAHLSNLSNRERRTLAIGALIALVLFVLAVLLPLERHLAEARAEVAHKQSDLAWMRRVAPELAAAGPAHHDASLPLIVLINQSAHQVGIGAAVSGSTPNGRNALNLQLQHVPFDQMIQWLAHLQRREGVQVVSAHIHAAGGPGRVNAALDLKRP